MEIKKGSGWIIARSEIIIAEVTKFGLIPIFSHPYTHPVFQHLLWGGLSILEKRNRKTELDLRDNEDGVIKIDERTILIGEKGNVEKRTVFNKEKGIDRIATQC